MKDKKTVLKWVVTILVLVAMVAAVIGVVYLVKGSNSDSPLLNQTEEVTTAEETETREVDPAKDIVDEVEIEATSETTTAKDGETTTMKGYTEGVVEEIVSTSPGAKELS